LFRLPPRVNLPVCRFGNARFPYPRFEREEVRNVRKSTLIRLLVVLATVGGTLASGFGRGELVWPP
jgi:hypothetical protein